MEDVSLFVFSSSLIADEWPSLLPAADFWINTSWGKFCSAWVTAHSSCYCSILVVTAVYWLDNKCTLGLCLRKPLRICLTWASVWNHCYSRLTPIMTTLQTLLHVSAEMVDRRWMWRNITIRVNVICCLHSVSCSQKKKHLCLSGWITFWVCFNQPATCYDLLAV